MAASEMCIPYPPPLQPTVGFISVFFVNFANHRQRDYKWFKITNNTIDKRVTIRDKIIAKLSLASLLLLYSTFAYCLIPVLTLVVLLVMLHDIDGISFSKRRYFLIVSWMSISVYCIPTRDTHITRDMCMGIHISRGYTYHCDTGMPISLWQRPLDLREPG